MKSETGETMAVQALQECLGEVPFLKARPLRGSDRGAGAETRWKVQAGDRTLTLLAEYRSSGQPRLAREAVLRLSAQVANGRGDYGVFLAPYISPAAASVCEASDTGYLDLAGNCLISFGTIYVRKQGGANPKPQRRELRSLYSAKAERVLRVLLTRSREAWKTAPLAEAAGVSLGQVSNVKRLLEDREWLSPEEKGLRLNNPGAVLDDWAAQYRYSRNQSADYYTLDDVAESEYKLAEFCARKRLRYSLTAFSGAARLAPAVRYQRAVAYLDGDPDALANALGWKRVTSGANVSLLVPYDDGVFYGSSTVDEVQVATPIQIYLDLQNFSGRGQEAAQAVRKVIERSW